jgi:hypothetical protein
MRQMMRITSRGTRSFAQNRRFNKATIAAAHCAAFWHRSNATACALIYL